MTKDDTVIAVFQDHGAADAAVRRLAAAGFALESLSVVGKGFHTEEKAVGFYNMGDRVRVWGSRGALWGGLWGLFLGGMFMTVPVVGHVIVLGYLAATAVSAVEGAAVVGGISALGAAFSSIGLEHNSVVRYETAVQADGFLVMAHGSAKELERAKAILADGTPSSVDVHPAVVSAPEHALLMGNIA